MQTKTFKDLMVWRKAYELAKESCLLTKNFPKEEAYGLSQQLRRSAVSIPSNIAEGSGRQFNREYRQFLAIAYGSLCEFETQYSLAVDLGYTKPSTSVENLMKEVGAMLYRMIHPKP